MSTFISPTWEGRVLSLACTNPTIIVSLHPLGLFGLHALWCERAKLSHKERMCLDFPLTSNEASVDSKLYSVLQRNFLLKPFSKTQWAPESTHASQRQPPKGSDCSLYLIDFSAFRLVFFDHEVIFNTFEGVHSDANENYSRFLIINTSHNMSLRLSGVC